MSAVPPAPTFTVSSVSVPGLTPRMYSASPSDRPSCGLLLARGVVIGAPQAACRATASRTEPRQSACNRALAQSLRRPPDLLHRRRCATAPASEQPLAGLRLAGGYRVGCSTTPEAAPLALSLLLSPSRQRRLLAMAGVCAFCPPSAPPASLAASSATSTPACSLCSIAPRPAGGKSQAIEHNSALPKATAPPAAKLLPAWAAARPAGSGNGLLCLAPPTVQLRYSALRGVSVSAARWVAYAQPMGRASAPVARSLAGCAGQSVGGCRPTTTDFLQIRSGFPALLQICP